MEKMDYISDNNFLLLYYDLRLRKINALAYRINNFEDKE